MKVKRVHIKMFMLVRISQFKEEEEDVFCKKKRVEGWESVRLFSPKCRPSKMGLKRAF